MTTQRSTFAKLQRERAKKAKAAAKREKRFDRGGEEDGEEIVLDDTTPSVQYDTEDTIRALDELHQRFEDKQINYDDFEERKTELLGRLAVE
ncbi:MAG TPA: hypothetical protein VH914_05585 [Acidimicrobiia bacterium]|nr:hypothetical protein [Acidimicrobiia bacterium]